MKIISHRGNIWGPSPKTENTPSQIRLAVKHNFDVEVDVWCIDNNLFLGHDGPIIKVDPHWLCQYFDKLWIHCKNIQAVEYLSGYSRLPIAPNFFFHDKDQMTLTSRGIPWCYPSVYARNGITVVFDDAGFKSLKLDIPILGICTDRPYDYI